MPIVPVDWVAYRGVPWSSKDRNPWTLSALCTEQLADLCVRDAFDEIKVLKYLSNVEQKFFFIKCIYDIGRFMGGISKTFNLLIYDWDLFVAFLKIRDDSDRRFLHRCFQGVINSKFPIHHLLIAEITHRDRFKSVYSVKEIYEILLFATFLEEAGWFWLVEKLMIKVSKKIENVYIEDTKNNIQIEYYGPYNNNLPHSLHGQKNVYSASVEVKLMLLRCTLQQPSAINFKKAYDIMIDIKVHLHLHLLSNLKAEDQLALKVVYLTLCSAYHYSQAENNESLDYALQAMKQLINYGDHREELHTKQGEPINGVKIKPQIITDCLRQTSKSLMANLHYENSEKMMELAMNMTKMEHNGEVPKTIYFSNLLQDYGTILEKRHKWKKSHNCFSISHEVKK